jgi:hypothetical protein
MTHILLATLPGTASYRMTTLIDIQPDQLLRDPSTTQTQCERCSFRYFIQGIKGLRHGGFAALPELDRVFQSVSDLLDAAHTRDAERIEMLRVRIGADQLHEIVPAGEDPRLDTLRHIHTCLPGLPLPRLRPGDRLVLPPGPDGPLGLAERFVRAHRHAPDAVMVGYMEHAAAVDQWSAFCEAPSQHTGWDALEASLSQAPRRPRLWMAYSPCVALQWPANRALEARRARLDVHFRVLDDTASYMCPENVSAYGLFNDVNAHPSNRGRTASEFAIRCDRLLLVFER